MLLPMKYLSLPLLLWCFLMALTSTQIWGQTMNNSRAERIIQQYGNVLSKYTDNLVVDLNKLPFSKNEIKNAINFVIPKVDNHTCQILRAGYMQLGMFQSAGDIKMLEIPKKFERVRDEELFDIINRRLDSKFFSVNQFVISEMNQLLKEIRSC